MNAKERGERRHRDGTVAVLNIGGLWLDDEAAATRVDHDLTLKCRMNERQRPGR